MNAVAVFYLAQSLIALALLVGSAVFLGALSKSGKIDQIQRDWRWVIAFEIFCLFVWGIFSAIFFAYHIHLGWIWSTIIIILMLPFYLGATYISSGEFKLLDDELIILKGSLLDKFMFDFMGFSRQREWNLCNISWLSAGLIVATPIVVSIGGVVVLLLLCVSIIISFVRFLILGESPHWVFKRIITSRMDPDITFGAQPIPIRVFGMRLFPLFWLGLGALTWSVSRHAASYPNRPDFFFSIAFTVVLSAIILIKFCWHTKATISTPNQTQQFYLDVIVPKVKAGVHQAIAPLGIFPMLYFAVKQNACPRIRPEKTESES